MSSESDQIARKLQTFDPASMLQASGPTAIVAS